jgi:hypothetical protein
MSQDAHQFQWFCHFLLLMPVAEYGDLGAIDRFANEPRTYLFRLRFHATIGRRMLLHEVQPGGRF